MGTGAITSYIDVAQLVLYAFWAFFAAVIYYLVRENHREGYPMDTDAGVVTGWPAAPPKTYLLEDGSTVTVPREQDLPSTAKFEPLHREQDSAVGPVGDPLLAGVGPGAWNLRIDHPDEDSTGEAKLRPLLALTGYGVAERDPDPRGMPVVDANGDVAGTVRDLWVDRSELMFRYLEVEVPVGAGTRRVMVPMPFARVTRREVQVPALLAPQFAGVPGIAAPDRITMREEERIAGYFGAGLLYAEPTRTEPIV